MRGTRTTMMKFKIDPLTSKRLWYEETESEYWIEGTKSECRERNDEVEWGSVQSSAFGNVHQSLSLPPQTKNGHFQIIDGEIRSPLSEITKDSIDVVVTDTWWDLLDIENAVHVRINLTKKLNLMRWRSENVLRRIPSQRHSLQPPFVFAVSSCNSSS